MRDRLHGAVAVEHGGSRKYLFCWQNTQGRVAQLAEQLTLNPKEPLCTKKHPFVSICKIKAAREIVHAQPKPSNQVPATVFATLDSVRAGELLRHGFSPVQVRDEGHPQNRSHFPSVIWEFVCRTFTALELL